MNWKSNKMKFILTFSLFVSQLAFSQSNFLDGYIILKNQSDTTKGKISYLNWSVNPKKIYFRGIGLENQEIDISTLKAFGVNGIENYIVKKVNLDETPFSNGSLLHNRNLRIKRDTTLALLVLLQAKYSLYHFNDADEKEHFFIDEAGFTKELINHKFLIERNSKTYEIEDKQYVSQIDSLFSNCSNKISTNNLKYETNILTEKLIEFNDCMGCKYTCFIKKSDDKGFKTIELIGGLNTDLNKHVYLGGPSNNTTRSFIPSLGLNIGASYSIHSKRDNGNRVIRFEAIYENLLIKSKLFDYYFTVPFINVNAIARRVNPINHLSYGAGIDTQIWIGSKSKTINNHFNSFDMIDYKPYFIFDLGYSKNNFELFLRSRFTILKTDLVILYPTNDISSPENITFNYLKLQLLCSYTFNNKRK